MNLDWRRVNNISIAYVQVKLMLWNPLFIGVALLNQLLR